MSPFWWGFLVSAFVWVPVGFFIFALLTAGKREPTTIREGRDR